MNARARLHLCPICNTRYTIFDKCLYCRQKESHMPFTDDDAQRLVEQAENVYTCEKEGHRWKDVGLNLDQCSRCGQTRFNWSDGSEQDEW